MVSVGETLWICFSWTNIQWAHIQWQVLCWGPEFQQQQGPWPHRVQFTLGGCLLSLWWLQCPKITSHSSLWLKHGWFQSQAPAHCPHLSLSCWYMDTTLIQKKPSGEDQHQQRHSWINTQNKALLVNCALAHGSKPSEWGLLSISAIKAYLPHTRPWSAPSELETDVKDKAAKTAGDNIQTTWTIYMTQRFSSADMKSTDHKRKVYNILFKVKNYSSKSSRKRVKRQVQVGGATAAGTIHKGLVSGVYAESLRIMKTVKGQSIQVKNQQKPWTDTSEKRKPRWPTHVWEIKIKTGHH